MLPCLPDLKNVWLDDLPWFLKNSLWEPNNKLERSGSISKIVCVFESVKSTTSNGVEWFVFTFSFDKALIVTSSVSISIFFSFKFSLANDEIENSSLGTSIDLLNLFSLNKTLKLGSTKFVEPVLKLGFKDVCNLACLIFDLKRVSFLTSYANSSLVLAGVSESRT